MPIKNITGVIRNSDGATTPFSGTLTVSVPPVFSSLTAVPASAVAGTPRTITITGSDPDGLPLTYECSVDGVALAPTSTPGVFVWGG